MSPLDEVARLMDERAKYEAFLVELDKGGGNKPEHVVAKVKADYTAKLTDVVERLKANHDVLTEHSKSLTEQLKKLEAEEKAILDEQAEAEIRKQVGELSDSDWLVSSKKAEARIIKIKENQQLTSGDINRIRGILGASPALSAANVTPTSTPAQADAPVKAVTDELAFLKSVVGTGNLPKAKAAAAPSAPPAPARTSGPSAEPRPSAEKPAQRPSEAAPVQARPSQMKERLIEPDPMDVEAAKPPPAEPVKPVGPPTPAKGAGLVDKPQADVKISAKSEKPMGSNVPDGDLQLKARTVPGAKKTLKCPECGALNNPSEWYCERCGAELTSNI